MQFSIFIGCLATAFTVNAIVLPNAFYVGIYDKAALANLAPGETPVPGWVLCHPAAGARWALYAADLATDCNFERDGPDANMWSFSLPGSKPLEEDDTFRSIFLAGSGSDLTFGIPEGLTATFDMGIVNTYFSYGYTDGLYRSAPDDQVLIMERDDQPRAGDILDFTGVAGKPNDQKALRRESPNYQKHFHLEKLTHISILNSVQTFGGVGGEYWNIGRGLTLPVSADVPVVEFRIMKVVGELPLAVETIAEQIDVASEFADLSNEEDIDYRVFEDMVPKQSKFGALANAGRGFLGKVAKSIGNKLTGNKNAVTTVEESKEDFIAEQIPPANNPRFQAFEMDVSTQNRRNPKNGQL
ncbi:hypothetical protein ABW21_db0200086 [Orbilia brochopaga]|nr:hypothetical protein ABW21_db0200086 [Drechslerella brochopaga]